MDMNVIPASINTVINHVEKFVIKEFVKGLKDVDLQKRKDAWKTRYLTFVGKLDDGFDIKRNNKKRSKENSASRRIWKVTLTVLGRWYLNP